MGVPSPEVQRVVWHHDFTAHGGALMLTSAVWEALQASYSGLAIRFRQLSRSSISPCEQVGEHPGGAGGCLAPGDSGGIRVDLSAAFKTVR